MSKPPGFSNVFKVVAFVCISLVIVGGIGAAVYWGFTGKSPLSTGSVNNILNGPVPTPTAPPVANVAPGQQETLDIVYFDNLNGSSYKGETLYVYDSNLNQKDKLTIGTGNAVSTASLWTPGQTGYLYLPSNSSGFVRQYTPFVVPSVATIGQYGQPSYYVQAADVLIGTYTIKCFDQYGNQYTSDTNYCNFTTLGVSSVTLSFTIYNSVTNTGWISSTDPFYNINMNAGVTMSTTGSSLSFPTGLSGLSKPATFPRGTSTYWSGVVSDNLLTNQKVGQTQTQAGQVPFSLTINKAALTAGSAQNETISLVAPFDSTYYGTNGVGGPNASSLATFYLGVAD